MAASGAVPGSGTASPVPLPLPSLVVALQAFVLIVTSSVSIVTAPFFARARPHAILAPVSRVMLVSARMFPANSVVVPRVAELPTWQKRSLPSPPSLKRTEEAPPDEWNNEAERDEYGYGSSSTGNPGSLQRKTKTTYYNSSYTAPTPTSRATWITALSPRC